MKKLIILLSLVSNYSFAQTTTLDARLTAIEGRLIALESMILNRINNASGIVIYCDCDNNNNLYRNILRVSDATVINRTVIVTGVLACAQVISSHPLCR